MTIGFDSKLNIIRDARVNCYSVMTTVTIRDYLELVRTAFENRGGIKGQRDPLKTNTAIRIRQRMIKDLQAGAVLPPIVVGLVVSNDVLDRLEDMEVEEFQKLLENTQKVNISIIDGIQRTTALNELSNDLHRKMRVEYWIASNTNSLIYRMLVLNTGQVPWNLRRQVEIVFSSLLAEIITRVPNICIIEIDDGARRNSAGKFQADQVIELFLVFGARKEKISTQEKLADEFTRLDFIEATSHNKFTDMFSEALQYLVNFDLVFALYQSDHDERNRFSDGKDLFSSQPAQVGFVAAVAVDVLGRPGGPERSQDEQEDRLKNIKLNADKMLERLRGMAQEELGLFLDFDTLNELVTNKKSGKVGDFEREFFFKAFQTLIEQKFDVNTMTSCWRAY
jgi:hypothetical protein